MFNKEALIKAVAEFKKEFPGEEPILLHGCSLVMHGAKPVTGDIDIYVEDVVKKLEGKLEQTTVVCALTPGSEETEVTKYEYKDFDFGFGFKQDIDFVMMDGVAVQTLEQIIEQKKIYNRPKDIISIKIIEAFLKENSNA